MFKNRKHQKYGSRIAYREITHVSAERIASYDVEGKISKVLERKDIIQTRIISPDDIEIPPEKIGYEKQSNGNKYKDDRSQVM
jgi:hypothetical protein